MILQIICALIAFGIIVLIVKVFGDEEEEE